MRLYETKKDINTKNVKSLIDLTSLQSISGDRRTDTLTLEKTINVYSR